MASRRAFLRHGLALVAAAVVAGCGGSGGDAPITTTAAPGPASTVATVPPTAPPVPLAPLTGLPADPALRDRPALSVKIDAAAEARPQVGLDKADLIFEEVVEGGLVRFMAVFQSKDAPTVGPVRSVRFVDAKLVTPLGGYFAYSGGNPDVVATIKKAPVKLVGFDELTKVYTRVRTRKAPHNMLTSTVALYANGGLPAGAPAPQTTFRPAGTPTGAPGAPVVARAQIDLTGNTKTSWAYDASSGRWIRSMNGSIHVLEGGAAISMANVVVLFVPYKDTNVRDAVGNVSPEPDVLGSGDLAVLTGDRLVRGRWTRPKVEQAPALLDQGGNPVALAPGPTWIVLAPTGAGLATT